MSGQRSAGIVLHRRGPDGEPQVLVAHMGGPFFARKDAGAWTFPKGLLEAEEDDLAAARREFAEELGLPVPDGDAVPLGEERQSGGKVVALWAVAGDLDPAAVVPGTFVMEWPRGSGREQHFPEVDRAAWLGLDEATAKLVKGQRVFVERLRDLLQGSGSQ